MKTKYHFIGIGGIGMSALARILLEKDLPVSGSDLSLNANTDSLLKKGATIFKGHAKEHISAEDIVIFSSQVSNNNPEFEAALSLKCSLLHRSQLLSQLMEGHHAIAVAGTHGKTTTTSLLTTVFTEGGLDPTFAVGGMLAGINGKLGKGKFFIAEADESDGSFLNYFPDGAIITNLGDDHLDHFKDKTALKEAFQRFMSQVKNNELLFYCGDDPLLKQLAVDKGVSYGFSKENALRISHFRQEGWSSIFDLNHEGKLYQGIKIALIGEHNALNAAAAFGLSIKMGITEEKIRSAFESFPGVGRRCEKKAEVGNILFVDDYAHHPTEIKKTLFAVKKAVQERRVVALFQPHRFSRLQTHFDEFAKAFEMADYVYVTDVYAACETPLPGIDGRSFLQKLLSKSNVPCSYLPKEHWVEKLQEELCPHDVLVTLGAGDVNQFHNTAHLFSPKKLKVGLVFGGRSCEHEISLRSARFVADSLDKNLYDLAFFAIDKEGKWIIKQKAQQCLTEQAEIHSSEALSLLDPSVTAEIEKCDLFLPILHGTFGEDGTIQGFFEMLGKPYIGPDYRSAAICMDKVLTKRIVEAAGVRTPKDISFGFLKWIEHREEILNEIKEKLSLPLYVKPVHLGSSVGISAVDTLAKLESAIDLAFQFDTQVLIEEGKLNCRELEFAIMGNSHSFPVIAPPPGEKLAQGEFVTYDKKYGQNAVQTELNPNLDKTLLEKGKKLARQAYEAVGCSGMTRVDFLLDSQGEFWMFEMNPIPGLQQLSLFPKIWKREGIGPNHLFDRLIILGLERYRKQNRHFKCTQSL